MRIFITALVAFVVTSALWILAIRYRPTWVSKIMYGADGFPRVKKSGDKFILNGSIYFYNGSIWVKLSSAGFPIDPAPKEGDTFIIDGVGYKFSNGTWNKITGPSGDETSRIRGVALFDANGNQVNPGVTFNKEVGYKYCLVPYDGDGDGIQDVIKGIPVFHKVKCGIVD